MSSSRVSTRPALHGRVFAAFSAAWVIPSLVGPFLAGAVTEYLHWRWVFLGVAGLTVVAYIMVATKLWGTPLGHEASVFRAGRTTPRVRGRGRRRRPRAESRGRARAVRGSRGRGIRSGDRLRRPAAAAQPHADGRARTAERRAHARPHRRIPLRSRDLCAVPAHRRLRLLADLGRAGTDRRGARVGGGRRRAGQGRRSYRQRAHRDPRNGAAGRSDASSRRSPRRCTCHPRSSSRDGRSPGRGWASCTRGSRC